MKKHLKNIINWKLFLILLIACVISSFLILPYVLALNPAVAKIFSPVLVLAQIIQATIIFSLAAFFGLLLAPRVGFGLPVLESYLQRKNPHRYLKSILGQSIGLGILATVLIVVLSIITEQVSVSLLKSEVAVPLWKSFLASFYGGIAEEVLMRLGIMTLFVWITIKIKKTKDNKPTKTGIWISIILSSIIFGLGHLPITSSLVAITPIVIFRAVLLNGVGGIIFGWLYQKHGLESAMISHFTADIGLHVVVPFIASFFV